MRDEIPQIESLGARVIVLGNGWPGQAASFRDEFGLHDRLLTDPARCTYRALGTRRGLGILFDPRMFLALLRALSRGFRQAGVQGDALQLGGTFLIHTDGSLPFASYARFAGDHLEPHTLLAHVMKHLGTSKH